MEQGLGEPTMQELAYVYTLKEHPTMDDFYFVSNRTEKDLKGIPHIRDNIGY